MQQKLKPEAYIGTWRRFGEVGPAYQVISVGEELPDGDRRVKIRLAETGEEVSYTLNQLADDEVLVDTAH